MFFTQLVFFGYDTNAGREDSHFAFSSFQLFTLSLVFFIQYISNNEWFKGF